MAPEERATVGSPRKRDILERVDNNSAVSGRLKCQMVLILLSLVCFSSSVYFFGKASVRESDPAKSSLMLLYSAFIIPPLVFGMSYARRRLATNHPTWCFVVEMFQAVISSITMTGSVQISMMKDEEKNILFFLGSMLLSVILLEIAIEDTDDCGVCDMILALLLTKWNATCPKYVPVVCFSSYTSKKSGTFTMKKVWNKSREAMEEDAEREAKETREAKERVDENALKEMLDCWIITKEKLATGTPEYDLNLKYPEFFRMGELIDGMHARASA